MAPPRAASAMGVERDFVFAAPFSQITRSASTLCLRNKSNYVPCASGPEIARAGQVLYRISVAEFRWNEWNIEHVARHAVTPEEAEEVVMNAQQPYPLKRADEKWLVWGATSNGRMLQVVSSSTRTIRSSSSTRGI